MVGGIAGSNDGILENNFVIGATIPAIEDNTRGAIVGRNIESTLTNNYYTACTVAGTANATNVGVGLNGYNQPVGDVAENNGALCVYKMTLAEGVTDVTVDASAKVYSYDSKDYYTPGTTVKLTYTGTPAKGYKFDGIDAGEGVTVTSSGNDYTITMPARDVIASINFILKGDINGDNVVNVADIVKAINDGKSQDEINEIAKIYQKDRTLGQSLAALKVMMQTKGLCEPWMLMPLTRLSADEEQAIVCQMRNEE